MKKCRFTDSQIIDVLKRVEAGLAVSELCQELSINMATLYKWRLKFGSWAPPLMVRMKELEEECRRLYLPIVSVSRRPASR
jgi:putative transposase